MITRKPPLLQGADYRDTGQAVIAGQPAFFVATLRQSLTRNRGEPMRAHFADAEDSPEMKRRVRSIFYHLHIEASEMASIVTALSWTVPLLLYPWFLSTSPDLAQVSRFLSREILLALVGSLLVYQIVCLIFGGSPLAPPQAEPVLPPMPTPAEARRSRCWLVARQCGLLAAVAIWAMLGFLLSTRGIVTRGSILYSCVAIGCAWGVWRFSFLIAAEKAYLRLREYRAVAESVEAEGLSADVIDRFSHAGHGGIA